MADMVRARFIRDILRSEGQRLLQQQSLRIEAETREHTGTLRSARRVDVYGGNGDFEGILTFTHPVYERFLDMKVEGRRQRRIHNRFVWGAYGRIASRLMTGFTEEVQEAIKREFDAIRAALQSSSPTA